MQEGAAGRTALVFAVSLFLAGGAVAAVTGVRPDLKSSGVTLIGGLPSWNISEICASDSANGQCRILEAQAYQTLSGGWNAVPDSFRDACLQAIKSPYDKSYRLLSQCLEGQVLKGLDKDIINTAAVNGGKPVRTAQAGGTTAVPGAGSGSGYAVLPTTNVADLFAAREAWGTGEAKSVEAPLAAGAVSPLPADTVTLPKGFEGEPTVHPLVATPPPQLTPVPLDQLADAMKKLLAEREGWLKAPAAPAEAAPAEKAPASAATGYAVLPTTNVADLFAAREAWGMGEAKAVDAPLATGAYSPLPSDAITLPKGFEGEPTIHPLQATPVAQLTPVPPGQLDDAMKKLLAERESWGTEPSKGGGAAAGAAGYAVLPTTNVADLFAAREAWGMGKAKAVAAPLAAGAKSPLPSDNVALPKGFEGEPTIHPLQATPVAQLTPVPPGQLDDAMKKLLAERESWGTEPSKGAPAAAAPAAKRSAEAADCEAKLRSAASKGVILFASGSAELSSKSNATLDALAAVAKGCSKGRIRVEGHTDATGRASSNKRLSEERAQAVAGYLTKTGVAKDRVEAVGYGEEKPIASNDTRDGRAKNRRIEFTVVE